MCWLSIVSLSFHILFGLLQSQKPLQEPNEYLSTTLQHYHFRFKGKDAIKRKQEDFAVAPDPGTGYSLSQAFLAGPYVATKQQTIPLEPPVATTPAKTSKKI